MDVHALATGLAAHPSIRSKLDIAGTTRALSLSAGTTGMPGDDAAAIPGRNGGWDLFAGEGFMPQFVQDDPWFAGWCGVMVNLSDIAAMGGRATALLDAVWAPDPVSAEPLLSGLRDAAAAYGVPIVGGHTNLRSPELNLAVSVTGRANRLISSFAAMPGDALIAAIDHRGQYRPRFDNWCAALDAPYERLRGDYELLPELADAGLVDAGKDISQGGIVGTALMLAESSRCGFDIALSDIPLPSGVLIDRWLRTFPSFGFLLSVRPERAQEVCAAFAARDICAASIGRATDSSRIDLTCSGQRTTFWDYAADPYISLSKEIAHA
ncbi:MULTISPECIES: sll0787 family AIR synthase-like protein [unclassified Rhizobium]|uniref:sll0787 family AIR synthase-like protein n=1 Tax=unclassified Rhizobium TaxID=2613769 RepID=UPI001ADCBAE7|nr:MULTISPECIES: sll0787 family AIR synthase-like protein [unclassified Rhizobium]MBO9123797.1 sll0787 family AIR synthase-like protein [Rhizobium sp. 16-488-2b]MBO9174329.1 sll0787 family AIR synthase-like protein [Rhizobium sp. 16-488-2a]